MKIKTNTLTEDEIANGEITNAYAVIQDYNNFKHYEEKNGLIIGIGPIGSARAFNKLDSLNEMCRLGKKCYSLLENDIKGEYTQNIEKFKNNNSNFQFVNLDNLISEPKNNSFIKSFLPTHLIDNEDIKEIAISYCTENGFPIANNDNSDYKNSSTTESVYFFKLHPFIAISILIYIIFEVQYAIKEIIGLSSSSKPIGKICDMFNKNDTYYIKEYLDQIKPFLYLFGIELDDDNVEELNLLELCRALTDKISLIENTTLYLQYKTENQFSAKYKKFTFLEIHHGTLSIAWEKLKINMFSSAGYYTKKCKSCGKIFESENQSTSYCDNESCQNSKTKLNSASSYKKLVSLHTELKSVFDSTTVNQLSKIDKNTLDDIKKYYELNTYQLKKLKDKHKIKNLEKYVKILKSCL